MKTLIIYSSHDGQTQKIAQFLAQRIEHCHVMPVMAELPISEFDRIVIGASVRYGHFDRNLYKMIEHYSAVLAEKSTVFFGVNLTARKSGKDTPETNVYVRKFLQRINWQPNLTAVFAGALRYPRYSFFDRIMIQFIMKITGGETDSTKDIEYTDWQKVTEFVQQIQQLNISQSIKDEM